MALLPKHMGLCCDSSARTCHEYQTSFPHQGYPHARASTTFCSLRAGLLASLPRPAAQPVPALGPIHSWQPSMFVSSGWTNVPKWDVLSLGSRKAYQSFASFLVVKDMRSNSVPLTLCVRYNWLFILTFPKCWILKNLTNVEGFWSFIGFSPTFYSACFIMSSMR